MKIVSNEDDFTIYLIGNNFGSIDIKDYVKNIVLKTKDRIKKYISGYYEVKVYINNSYGMILEIKKESDFDFFKDFIELDINIEDSTMYFKFKDYFAIVNKSNINYYDDNYYINVDKLNKKELLTLSEFGNIVYGKEIDKIEKKLSKIKFVV